MKKTYWLIGKRKVPVWTKLTDKRIYVEFDYDKDMIAEVKAMVGAQWHPAQRLWSVSFCERNMYSMMQLAGEYDTEYAGVPLERVEFNCSEHINLFSHQKECLQFALARKRVLVAADMGTGKTLVGLLLIANVKQPALVVGPKSALVSWKREIRKWHFSRMLTIRFTTYESLQKEEPLLNKFGVVIFDESYKIQNASARRSKLAAKVANHCRLNNKYLLLLSGAPSPRDPRSWHHQIEVIKPGWIRESDARKFGYRIGKWDFDGDYPRLIEWDQREVEAFARRIAPLCRVVRKRDVFDMPPKLFERLEVIPTSDYLTMAQHIAETSTSAIQALTRLRQLSDGFVKSSEVSIVSDPRSPKELALRQELEFYLDNPTPRAVIYASFRESLFKCKRLAEELGYEVGLSMGGHSCSVDFLEDFNSDDERPHAVVANPACTHGMNLQSSPCLLYYSNSFMAEDRAQSLERTDRPGKDTSISTRVVDFMHLETDVQILDLAERKLSLQKLTLDEIKRVLYAT